MLEAVAAGAYADGALERELGRMSMAGRDRNLATELAYGSIRQRRLLDAWLNELGRVPAERQPPKLRWLLHLGLYQLLHSDRVPAAAAIHTTVELAKRSGLARLAPVANGVLRGFQRRQQAGATLTLPEDPARALAIRHSMPNWLARSVLTWLPAEQAEAFAIAANQPPTIDLRINRLRTTPAAVLEALSSVGIEAKPIDGLPWALQLAAGSGDLRQLPGYAEGHWCVQDRAAQSVAPLLEPPPGGCVLDACAAPGGKTTHLAELMGDSGEIWAMDRDEARLRRVQRNSERLGLQAIQIHHQDAAQLSEQAPELKGRFDRILVDAPCSGLGTLARHADARWRITPESIEQLAVLQKQLLTHLLPLLKQGGLLVYATCSVHPHENADVIQALLKEQPQLSLSSSRQIWPGEIDGAGDGFFVACLRG